MRKIFLTSYFKEVSHKLPEFLNENLDGKTITFISTASLVEDITFYVQEAKDELEKLGLKVDELDISTLSTEEIYKKLERNDYIYISGGNTFFLLQELKRTKTDKIIKALIEDGKPYIGESAGSIVLSKNIEYIKDMDDYKKSFLKDFSALGIIDFYPLPHFGNFPFEALTKNIVNSYEDKLNLLAFNNSEIIIIDDLENKLIKI